jgi:hypothetical protein
MTHAIVKLMLGVFTDNTFRLHKPIIDYAI